MVDVLRGVADMITAEYCQRKAAEWVEKAEAASDRRPAQACDAPPTLGVRWVSRSRRIIFIDRYPAFR